MSLTVFYEGYGCRVYEVGLTVLVDYELSMRVGGCGVTTLVGGASEGSV